MKPISYLSAFALLAVALVPASGRAQIVISGGGSGTFTMSTDGTASSSATTDSANGGVISADSFATLKKYVKTKTPIIIIDHEVTTAAALNKLKFAHVATVKFAEGESQDIKHYGDKAKNGILSVITKPADAKDATPTAPAAAPSGGMTIQLQTTGGG